MRFYYVQWQILPRRGIYEKCLYEFFSLDSKRCEFKISHEIHKDTAKINLKKKIQNQSSLLGNYNKYSRRFKKCHLFKVQDEIFQRKE